MAIVVMNEVVSHFMSLSPTPASSPISTAMWALHIAAKFGINNYAAAADAVVAALSLSRESFVKRLRKACGETLIEDFSDEAILGLF